MPAGLQLLPVEEGQMQWLSSLWYLYGQQNINPAGFYAVADTGCTKDHNEDCVYPEAQRRTRKRKLEEREQKVEDQLARMEMMLRAATQQIPAVAQDQHPAQTVTTSQEINHVDSGRVDSSGLVPQQQNPAPADPGTRDPSNVTERSQWLQSPEQDCPSVQDNSIEVQVASMGAQGEVSAPVGSPTLASPPRGQPSSLNSAVAGYQGLLSSPSLEVELPDIFASEPTVPSPCEAGGSFQRATATVSAPASRHVDSSGPSDSDWPHRNTQQNPHDPAVNDSLRDTINVQVQAQPQALVTPPSTAAHDGLEGGLGLDADAPCDEDPEAEPCEAADDNGPEDSAYHISICSPPGVEWVSHQIGKPGFGASARRLSVDMKRNERLERIFDSTRSTEPDRQTAFRWTKAYFETAIDSVFGVLDQAEFETRLGAHFQGVPSVYPLSTLAQDKAWYALRNTVYALGCRVSLSQEAGPDGFAESRTRSWQYFENALAVHTDIIYGRAEVTSIRALILMAFYAEALGSPALEYMLLSNATRLAQSKGLHLAYSEASKPEAGEALSRQWLWWVLYAYEKHVAYRSGRPSAIDEDYVNCPLPSTMAIGPTGPNSANVEFVRATIQHAQVSSAISKQLLSAKAMRDSLETTMAHVQALEKRLDDWRNSLHPEFISSPPFSKYADRPRRAGTQTSHIVFLHFCYYSSLIAIHGVFCYPWNRPELQQQQQKQQRQDGRALHISSPQVHAQIERSTKAVADASRQIILAVQGLEITSAMPLWLTFFFPLVGLINLFVYILKNPLAPSAASDLSLMDVVVGHFGYLQFISSSQHVFPFPREIAAYARHVVETAVAEKKRRLSTAGGHEPQQHRQKQGHHRRFEAQQTHKKQKTPQIMQDNGLFGGFINGQDMLLQQMATFPPEVTGLECSDVTMGVDLREDWYGASMPPLPQLGSFGWGTNSNLADPDEVDFLNVPTGEAQH